MNYNFKNLEFYDKDCHNASIISNNFDINNITLPIKRIISNYFGDNGYKELYVNYIAKDDLTYPFYVRHYRYERDIKGIKGFNDINLAIDFYNNINV